MADNPGYDGFIWFIGVVDDINDPDKMGRVKVRDIIEHVVGGNNRDNTKTDDLPWANVLMPITSASNLGIGQSPTGLKKGSKVLCFYEDGMKKSIPHVIGSLHSYDDSDASSHSVSKHARGEWKDTGVKLGPEPKSSYAAKYPYNNTINTESGHVIEIDDTPKNERINIRHRDGAYIEMRPGGDIVTRTVGNHLDITQDKKIIFAANGNITIIADTGDINIISNAGSINLESPNGVVNIQAAVIGLNP